MILYSILVSESICSFLLLFIHLYSFIYQSAHIIVGADYLVSIAQIIRIITVLFCLDILKQAHSLIHSQTIILLLSSCPWYFCFFLFLIWIYLCLFLIRNSIFIVSFFFLCYLLIHFKAFPPVYHTQLVSILIFEVTQWGYQSLDHFLSYFIEVMKYLILTAISWYFCSMTIVLLSFASKHLFVRSEGPYWQWACF